MEHWSIQLLVLILDSKIMQKFKQELFFFFNFIK